MILLCDQPFVWERGTELTFVVITKLTSIVSTGRIIIVSRMKVPSTELFTIVSPELNIIVSTEQNNIVSTELIIAGLNKEYVACSSFSVPGDPFIRSIILLNIEREENCCNVGRFINRRKRFLRCNQRERWFHLTRIWADMIWAMRWFSRPACEGWQAMRAFVAGLCWLHLRMSQLDESQSRLPHSQRGHNLSCRYAWAFATRNSRAAQPPSVGQADELYLLVSPVTKKKAGWSGRSIIGHQG